MRLTRFFSISAVLAASIVGFGAAPAANAHSLCEEVTVYGSIVVPATAGQCDDQVLANFCQSVDTGLPQAGVSVYVCLPAPLANQTGTGPSQ